MAIQPTADVAASPLPKASRGLLRGSAVPLLLLAAACISWGLTVQLARYPGYVYFDTIDAVLWSRNGFTLDTGPHPPLLPWLLHAIDLAVPLDRHVLAVIAMVNMGLCGFAVWKIARTSLGFDRAYVALLLLGWVPYATWISLRFNHNSLLVSLWPLTVWAFLACLRRPTWLNGALLGAAAGAGLLTKYFHVLLLVAIFAASLWSSRRRQFYRSAAPYVAAAVAAAIIAPHFYAMYLSAGFEAALAHPHSPIAHALQSGDGVFASLQLLIDNLVRLGMLLAGFLIIVWFVGLSRDTRDRDGESFGLLVLLTLVPIALTVVVVAGLGLNSRGDWTGPAFTILPVVLAGLANPPRPDVGRKFAMFTCAACIGLPIAGPAMLYIDFYGGTDSAVAPHQEIVRDAGALYSRLTGRPVALVSGATVLAAKAAFELAEKPDTAGFQSRYRPHRSAQEGLMLLCLESDEMCRKLAEQKASNGIECSLKRNRTYLNLTGPTYVANVYIAPAAGEVLHNDHGSECRALGRNASP